MSPYALTFILSPVRQCSNRNPGQTTTHICLLGHRGICSVLRGRSRIRDALRPNSDGELPSSCCTAIRRGAPMARSVTLALRHALTSLTLLLCLFNVPIWAAPATANAVCQATPKSSAAGSHWYYRVDRSSQRKCWYLAAQGQTVRRAVSRVTSRTQKVANVAPFPTTDPIVM